VYLLSIVEERKGMIQGRFDEYMVYVGGQPLDLAGSLKIRNHSPDGFMWGYGGSGPSQLALALLLHFGATAQEALSWYQTFKGEIIAQLPQTDFEMQESVVVDWLEARRIFSQELEHGQPTE